LEAEYDHCVLTSNIYDLSGRWVAELDDQPNARLGYGIRWDGKRNGKVVPPGIYLLHVEARATTHEPLVLRFRREPVTVARQVHSIVLAY
jgi:hypothetical protein